MRNVSSLDPPVLKAMLLTPPRDADQRTANGTPAAIITCSEDAGTAEQTPTTECVMTTLFVDGTGSTIAP